MRRFPRLRSKPALECRPHPNPNPKGQARLRYWVRSARSPGEERDERPRESEKGWLVRNVWQRRLTRPRGRHPRVINGARDRVRPHSRKVRRDTPAQAREKGG